MRALIWNSTVKNNNSTAIMIGRYDDGYRYDCGYNDEQLQLWQHQHGYSYVNISVSSRSGVGDGGM